MSMSQRLVIFDVDGTLVDSQRDILSAMAVAFAVVDQPLPDRDTLLGQVGLSLEVIFPNLLPALDAGAHASMVKSYKTAYMDLRARLGVADSSPLYPGALETLHHLAAMSDVVLGVATGKSKRGLDKLIEGHGLSGMFATQQVSDFHPSKPHPSMILQAMAETGMTPAQTVMIGDTGFDMEMAAAAGVAGIGVSWGYHPVERLGQAGQVVADFAALRAALTAPEGISA